MQQNEKKITANEVFSEESISPDIFNETGKGVIPSIAIDRIIAHRQSGISLLQSAMKMLTEAKLQFKEAGCEHSGGMSFPRLIEGALHSYDGTGKWEKVFLRDVDREIWQKLMHDTGMLTLMNSDQINDWHNSLYSKDMPEITLENVMASFTHLHATSHLMFENGILSIFEKLSWDYKTNNPRKFGKKIIINSLVDVTRWGVSARSQGVTRIDDLEKAFCLFDKKKVPDFRDGTGLRFSEFVKKNQFNGEIFEADYFSIRYFKKGSGHITFMRMDLVEKMNDVLAKHFPDALPPE